jgi:hypothetical protein
MSSRATNHDTSANGSIWGLGKRLGNLRITHPFTSRILVFPRNFGRSLYQTMNIIRILFAAFLFPALCASIQAKDTPGATDHPLLKRVDGSEIIWSKTAKFDEFTVPLERVEFDYGKETFKATKQEKAEGAHTTLYYKLPGETSTLEVVKQYEADLNPAGFETIFTAANDKLDDGFNRFVSQTFPTVKGTKNLEYLHEFNHDEQRYLAMKGKGKSGNTIYVTSLCVCAPGCEHWI